MRDILIGLGIIVGAFIIIDFISTEKNVCVINNNVENYEYKCGILYKEMNIKIDLFDRFW